jgi:hypothetical protein
MTKAERGRLVLREAAGCFWLVDPLQPGRPYRPPLRLNAAGAEIWRGLARGRTPAQIAAELAAAGGVSEDEALRDVEAFAAQLEKELLGTCKSR